MIENNLIPYASKEALCNEYKGVIYKVAKRFRRMLSLQGAVGYDDLIQSGYVALIRAQQTYDPHGGRSFLGHAMTYIKYAVMRELGIRWRSDTGLQYPAIQIRLDAPVYAQQPEGLTWFDKVSDEMQFSPVDENLLVSESERIINQCIDSLPEKEAYFIRECVVGDKSIAMAAREINCSYGTAKAIRERGLIKLRNKLQMYHVLDDAEAYRNKSAASVLRTGSSVVQDIAFNRISMYQTICKSFVE